jgi:hypothetical protein
MMRVALRLRLRPDRIQPYEEPHRRGGPLRLDVTPGSLGRLIPEAFRGDSPPLWGLKQQPSVPETKSTIDRWRHSVALTVSAE